MNLVDIMPALAQPFAIGEIDFRPKQSFERDGKIVCLALPFADKRVYEDRLNSVCPGEWSSQMSITVAGSKIIAVSTVTICGVPHTDVGEADMGENSATEAAAQAFKRACSQVGLGRYLYSLAKQYLPFDKQKKRIALSANEMLAAVKSMYKAAGLLPSAPAKAEPATPAPASADDAPVTTEQINAITIECKRLRRRVPPPNNFVEAEKLLVELRNARAS